MASTNPQMLAGIGELSLAQEDGERPTTLAAGCAAGESGVIVLNLRFHGGLHLSATSRWHLICFQLFADKRRFECRMADRTVSHSPLTGSLAICPAGIDSGANAEGSVDVIFIAIDPRRVALAAAEDNAIEAQLIERMPGYDLGLLDLARNLVSQSAGGYPEGPLFWNECASAFIDGLVARHTSRPVRQTRGTLGRNVLDRLRDYILAHLDEPVEVGALAELAGRSPFQFTRVFARSVGMTPHRYIVHLRLQRAIELVRDGRSGLAEIAAHTGFADQSHLSRWVRRVYGVSLTQLIPD
jgi:AraC family transcriptional regulator